MIKLIDIQKPVVVAKYFRGERCELPAEILTVLNKTEAQYKIIVKVQERNESTNDLVEKIMEFEESGFAHYYSQTMLENVESNTIELNAQTH